MNLFKKKVESGFGMMMAETESVEFFNLRFSCKIRLRFVKEKSNKHYIQQQKVGDSCLNEF